jgi:hypothetical protein
VIQVLIALFLAVDLSVYMPSADELPLGYFVDYSHELMLDNTLVRLYRREASMDFAVVAVEVGGNWNTTAQQIRQQYPDCEELFMGENGGLLCSGASSYTAAFVKSGIVADVLVSSLEDPKEQAKEFARVLLARTALSERSGGGSPGYLPH